MFFSKRKAKKAEELSKNQIVQRLRTKSILYVASRSDNKETILCKAAAVSISDTNELIIHSDNKEIVRIKIETAHFGELMSLGGAIVWGEDVYGNEINIVAYYTSEIKK